MKKVLLVLTCFFSLTSFSIFAQKQLFSSEKTPFTTTILLKKLHFPWSMVELPDSSFLFSLRSGSILHYDKKNNRLQQVSGVPAVSAKGQGGLFDLLLDPDFDQNNTIYFSYMQPSMAGGAALTVASAVFQNNQLTKVKTIVKILPQDSARINLGGRLAFVQGNLYVTVGDHNKIDLPQNLTSLLGKILRFDKQGGVPSSNPWFNQPNKQAAIYSYGHRNPQGLAWDEQTNRLWETEHGPMGGDEVNLLIAGKNYGWALVSYGRHYNGDLVNKGQSEMPGTESPKWHWTPSIAPSSLIVYRGKEFPQWDGNLFVSSLRGQRISRLETKENSIVHEEKLLTQEFGRIRNLFVDKAGKIYLLTDSSNGYLVVLEKPPAE